MSFQNITCRLILTEQTKDSVRFSWILVAFMLFFIPSIAIAQESHYTLQTFLPLSLRDAKIIHVGLVLETTIPSTKIEAVKSAIVSSDYLTNDGQRLYKGWQGALSNLGNQPGLVVPQKFDISESKDKFDKIIIKLTNKKNPNGYNGYTNSVSQTNYEVLQSSITIYDINSLNNNEISEIVRHEFGHALGLGHSTVPYDLMNPDIYMENSYVSFCDIAGIRAVYNGHIQSHIYC